MRTVKMINLILFSRDLAGTQPNGWKVTTRVENGTSLADDNVSERPPKTEDTT
jgi:hypothetical protein